MYERNQNESLRNLFSIGQFFDKNKINQKKLNMLKLSSMDEPARMGL